MGANTKIQWADHSWSPWRGCTKVSPGCTNCYAEALSRRNPAVLGEWGKGRPRVLAKNWKEPVRWNSIGEVCGCGWSIVGECGCGRSDGRNQRVFPSLCDWLDEEVPVEWLVRFLHLIHETPNLDWLLLTKRPENWELRIRAVHRATYTSDEWSGVCNMMDQWWARGHPPRNVWFGASVEDQVRADQRVAKLLQIPARIRWLSVEPLLGPVDLQYAAFNGADPIQSIEGIHWVVVGGESGRGARDCDLQWIRSLVRQGAVAGVPVFVKQLGSRPIVEPGPISMETEDPKGGDPSEWPEDLRVRQYPSTQFAAPEVGHPSRLLSSMPPTAPTASAEPNSSGPSRSISSL